MTQDIDFHAIGESLRLLIESSNLGFNSVLHEPDEIQINAINTPLAVVMMGQDGNSAIRAGQSYYDTWRYEVEIIAIDLTSWASAAKKRTELFRATRGIVRANPRFHPDLDATQLGAYEFERAIDRSEDTWFAAVARFEVVCNAYYDR